MANEQRVHDVWRTYGANYDLSHPQLAIVPSGTGDGVAVLRFPALAELRPLAGAAFGPSFPERNPNRKECEHTVQSNPRGGYRD